MSGQAAARPDGPRSWRLVFFGAVAVCAAALVANLWLAELEPASVWGTVYGSAAAVLALAAAGYGLRRRAARAASRWGAGTAGSWLDFHIWGGLLFALLMLMHSAFRLPSGWVNGWLWALSLWTVASGVAGRLLQRWIPRVLASGLSTEVLYERIPVLVEEIRERAEAVADASGEAIRSLYDRGLAADLAAPRRRWIYFFDITGGAAGRLAEFAHLRPLLAAEEGERLAELENLYRTKLEIDAHYTLQQALRGWLYAHLPVSFLLLVFILLHLYTVLFY